MLPTPKKIIRYACLFIATITLASCSKNQDQVDLPIYDSIGGDFTLPTSQGDSLSLHDLKGRVVFLNFGYTNCPDVCPVVLNRLAKLEKELASQQPDYQNSLQTLFISVDPERDTATYLKEYLAFFDQDFIGLSGSLEQIQEVTKRYAVYFEKQPEAEDGYQVIHNDKIFLLDKKGRIRALFSQSDPDEKVLQTTRALLDASLD